MNESKKKDFQTDGNKREPLRFLVEKEDVLRARADDPIIFIPTDVLIGIPREEKKEA